MEEIPESFGMVLITFTNNQTEEYYMDSIRETIGEFMEGGWGRFYNPRLRKWEFINMQHILKVSYENKRIHEIEVQN